MTPFALLLRLQLMLLADPADNSADDPERGDVPGWVLITIMTAGLVTIVWGVASTELQSILKTALHSVTHP